MRRVVLVSMPKYSGTVSLRPYPVRMLAYWHMDGTHYVS